ncbi:MAG: hypothetical protein J4G04_05490 [Nitrosopumilaceae archaeon]|nr:hypothetical protein [Nitrosopumilaceae archaeon]
MGRLIPCRVRARASISPSEDPQKVLEAMLNMMPGCTGEIQERTAEVRSGDMAALDTIRESLASRQTLGGLRRNMAGNIRDNTTKFLLNRQAAYAGVTAVCDTPEESPLGPIEVEVESRRIDDIILWISEGRTG